MLIRTGLRDGTPIHLANLHKNPEEGDHVLRGESSSSGFLGREPAKQEKPPRGGGVPVIYVWISHIYPYAYRLGVSYMISQVSRMYMHVIY